MPKDLRVRECSLALWVSLGLITQLRPWALCFSSGTLLWRAAPGAGEGHELGPDKCKGVSYTV